MIIINFLFISRLNAFVVILNPFVLLPMLPAVEIWKARKLQDTWGVSAVAFPPVLQPEHIKINMCHQKLHTKLQMQCAAGPFIVQIKDLHIWEVFRGYSAEQMYRRISAVLYKHLVPSFVRFKWCRFT